MFAAGRAEQTKLLTEVVVDAKPPQPAPDRQTAWLTRWLEERNISPTAEPVLTAAGVRSFDDLLFLTSADVATMGLDIISRNRLLAALHSGAAAANENNETTDHAAPETAAPPAKGDIEAAIGTLSKGSASTEEKAVAEFSTAKES